MPKVDPLTIDQFDGCFIQRLLPIYYSYHPIPQTTSYSRFRLARPHKHLKQHYDVVVVGSGYGGSIAACRSAQAGKSVCVLERGKEWLPGDFPESEFKSVKELQITTTGCSDSIGNETGIQFESPCIHSINCIDSVTHLCRGVA